MSRNEFAVICNEVIGTACNDCTEPCIMKFTDEEWESYKLYHRDITNALHEQQMIDDDIDEYYRLKNELMKDGLDVEEVVNLNINYLRQRKKEVSKRIRGLRQLEYSYTKKLMKLNNKNREVNNL